MLPSLELLGPKFVKIDLANIFCYNFEGRALSFNKNLTATFLEIEQCLNKLRFQLRLHLWLVKPAKAMFDRRAKIIKENKKKWKKRKDTSLPAKIQMLERIKSKYPVPGQKDR